MEAWIERTTAATAATDVSAIGPVADDLFQQSSSSAPASRWDATPSSVTPAPVATPRRRPHSAGGRYHHSGYRKAATAVMSDLRVPLPHQPVMTFEQMLEKVRYDGAYPTRERAEEVVRLVLSGLGRQLTGEERVELAARLPFEAASILTAQVPGIQPLTGWAFVKELAARTGATPATTRWDTGAVLAVVAALAGPDLLTRILNRLPTGYALLFGRAELVQAA